jgi:hypothetical protein
MDSTTGTTGTTRRRSLLSAGIGLTLAAFAAPTAAAAVSTGATRGTDPVDRDGLPVAGKIRRAVSFLDAMMDGYPGAGAPGLPQSYADQVGLYSTAFTYDAALAALAYLQDSRGESLERAKAIGDALLYAQQHDPQYSDGRLRQAYTVGPYSRGGTTQPYGFIRPDGTVNIGGPFGATASYTGDQAFAALALCALYRRTGARRFLTGARLLGGWIVATCTSGGALGGFTNGVDRGGTSTAALSTAHNADLVGLFGTLATSTGERGWLTQRDRAARFVRTMWQSYGAHFSPGSPDGRTLDTGPVSLDAQTRGWLAIPEDRYAGSLEYVADRLVVTDNPKRPNSALTAGQRFTGPTASVASRRVDPDVPIEPGLPKPDPFAVWFEGTAQLAAALNVRPADSAESLAHQFMIAQAQQRLGAGQTVGGQPLPDRAGVVAASSPLHAGTANSGYYPVRHVGTTAWYLLAVAGTNPLH